MKNILIAITGSIAAYKAADLVVELNNLGFNTKVIMSSASLDFITEKTMTILSKNLVLTDKNNYLNPFVEHVEYAKWCDCFVIVPATANTISKLAYGIADNIITTTALCLDESVKKIICPAMNNKMYSNSIIENNLTILKQNGYIEVEPIETQLACGDFAKGGLASISEIINKIKD